MILDKSILLDKLQTFDYYKNKLPLYLQESYGFQEHFRIWYDFLKQGVVKNGDIFLNLLLIFDPDYFTYVQENIDESITKESFEFDILDKIGSIFGVTRNFSIDVDGVTKNIKLDNGDFLILIKAQIIKNNCDGTREQISQFYDSIGMPIFIKTNVNAVADEYIITNLGDITASQNVQDMFKAGLLRIESVGIQYTGNFLNTLGVLVWDLDEDGYIYINTTSDKYYVAKNDEYLESEKISDITKLDSASSDPTLEDANRDNLYVYFNTTDNVWKFYNGCSWIELNEEAANKYTYGKTFWDQEAWIE